MAHYIGKFDTDAQIQQALDQGNLVKPYVAQYGNENDGIYLDYNSKTATPSGSTSLPSAETISYSYYDFYVNIYASNLYWSITTPEWVVAAQSEGYGDAYIQMSAGENESEDSRTGVVTFTFYYDYERTTVRNVVTYTLTQNGHVIADGYVEPSALTISNVAQDVNISIQADDLYWTMSGETWMNYGSPFEEYGSYSLNVHFDDASTDRSGNLVFNFYTDYERTDLKNTFVVPVTQEAITTASTIVWDSSWRSAQGQIAVSLASDADSWVITGTTVFYPDHNYEYTASGTTNEHVYYMTDANMDPNSGVTHIVDVMFYLSGSLVKTITLTIHQDAYVAPAEVHLVATYVTTTQNETKNVWAGDGMDGEHYGSALVDNTEWVDVTSGQYTFAEPGTHTLEYIRQSDGDLYLQGWCMNGDEVSVNGYAVNNSMGWGCHNNDQSYPTSYTFENNQNLTGVTFGQGFDRMGSHNFSGCTALTYISIANPNGFGLGGDPDNPIPFDTITSNSGTLHIPSGSTANYSEVIAALGNNWTVVDDIVIS